MDPDWVARLSAPDISLVSAENDFCLDGTRAMIGVLADKGIPHRFHVWGAPWGHEWEHWQRRPSHCLP